MTYLIIIFVFLLLFAIAITIFYNDKTTEYIVYVRFQKYIGTIVILMLTVINFIFSFLKAKILVEYIISIALNIFLFSYYIFDLLYNKQKNSKQLFEMQNKLLCHYQLKDLFTITESDISIDKSSKIVSLQYAYIPEKPGNIIVVTMGKIDYKLLPKREIDRHDLLIYMEQINKEIFNINYNMNYSNELDNFILKSYSEIELKKYNKTIIDNCNTKFYDFIISKKDFITKKFFPMLAYIFASLIFVIIAIDEFFNIEVLEWLYKNI